MKLGADPNAHDILGHTPLCYVLFYIYDDIEKVVSILLRYRDDPNYKIQYGNILLFMLTIFIINQSFGV